jgi:hypothetical protein
VHVIEKPAESGALSIAASCVAALSSPPHATSKKNSAHFTPAC